MKSISLRFKLGLLAVISLTLHPYLHDGFKIDSHPQVAYEHGHQLVADESKAEHCLLCIADNYTTTVSFIVHAANILAVAKIIEVAISCSCSSFTRYYSRAPPVSFFY